MSETPGYDPAARIREIRDLAYYASEAPRTIDTDSPLYRDMVQALYDATDLFTLSEQARQAAEQRVKALRAEIDALSLVVGQPDRKGYEE